MGAILNQIREAVRDHGTPEVGTSVTRAHTGRISESFTAEQQACERLVNQWLDGASDDAMAWGRLLVTELLAELPRCVAPQTFRARRFPKSIHPTDPLCFGPPPPIAAGRYNRAGQSALYLGMTTQGLRAEMEQYALPDQHFYFARYCPILSVSLVDLSAASAHAALHLAFDRAERLDLGGYEAAQRLADVVRELGIDGIIAPGVRGTKAYNYSNVVIFNCLDWATWVDMSHPPEPLPS
jgi:hypothetical protein